MSPKMQLDQEKRVRREIANSNERRRMQSINAGFENLKALIPHVDGEKYSKASILQMSCEHVKKLQTKYDSVVFENGELNQKNAYLEELVRKLMAGRYLEFERVKVCGLEMRSKAQEAEMKKKLAETAYIESPPPKRKKRDTESSDEGISMGGVESGDEALKEEPCIRHRQHWADAKRTAPDSVRPDQYGLLIAHTQEHIVNCPKPVTEVCKPAHQVHPFQHHQPVARQNLELMVQAIQHLEGERVFRDHIDDKSPTQQRGEEDDREGSLSDPEEFKSEAGSGCSSPASPPVVMYSAQLQVTSSPRAGSHPTSSAPPTVQSCSEKFPVARHLLHLPEQYLRPGVIVHKS